MKSVKKDKKRWIYCVSNDTLQSKFISEKYVLTFTIKYLNCLIVISCLKFCQGAVVLLACRKCAVEVHSIRIYLVVFSMNVHVSYF